MVRVQRAAAPSAEPSTRPPALFSDGIGTGGGLMYFMGAFEDAFAFQIVSMMGFAAGLPVYPYFVATLVTPRKPLRSRVANGLLLVLAAGVLAFDHRFCTDWHLIPDGTWGAIPGSIYIA